MSAAARLHAWRSSLGVCCICGQPVRSPQASSSPASAIASFYPGRKGGQAQPFGYDLTSAASSAMAALDLDGRLLTEESPLHVALMRFNALGELQFAHVLDDYVNLETKRSGVLFANEFAKHAALVLAANPKALGLFKTQVLDAPDRAVYNAAVATNRRVTENLTVVACRRCNMAMNRTASHVHAVYRSFSVTRDANVPLLESNSLVAVAAKKVLQEVAFFFEPIYDSDNNVIEWRAKSEDKLLKDGAFWRCVAHLSDWGQSPPGGGGGVRIRAVALFHASFYMYLSSSDGIRELLPFSTWHTYIFRPFIMGAYSPNTFLGLHQQEVAVLFDLSKKEGVIKWERALHARIMTAAYAMMTMADTNTATAAAATIITASAGPAANKSNNRSRQEEGQYYFYEQEEAKEERGVSERKEAPIRAIWRLEEQLNAANVTDELSLLRFMQRQAKERIAAHSSSPPPISPDAMATREAIAYWLSFFRFTLSGGGGSNNNGTVLWLRQIDALEQQLRRALWR